MSRARRWGLGLASALVAIACDPTSDGEPTELRDGALVGEVEGTDIVLGALLEGDTLAVYQCGGEETFESHTRWFRGVVGTDDDPDAFRIEGDGFELIGQRSAAGLDGELVEPDGDRHPFHVDPVADDSEAGVYVAVDESRSTGVVLQDVDGELVAQGASCSGLPRTCTQVIILAPVAVEDGTILVEFEADGATEQVRVERTLRAPDEV